MTETDSRQSDLVDGNQGCVHCRVGPVVAATSFAYAASQAFNFLPEGFAAFAGTISVLYAAEMIVHCARKMSKLYFRRRSPHYSILPAQQETRTQLPSVFRTETSTDSGTAFSVRREPAKRKKRAGRDRVIHRRQSCRLRRQSLQLQELHAKVDAVCSWQRKVSVTEMQAMAMVMQLMRDMRTVQHVDNVGRNSPNSCLETPFTFAAQTPSPLRKTGNGTQQEDADFGMNSHFEDSLVSGTGHWMRSSNVTCDAQSNSSLASDTHSPSRRCSTTPTGVPLLQRSDTVSWTDTPRKSVGWQVNSIPEAMNGNPPRELAEYRAFCARIPSTESEVEDMDIT